ncbi:N-terminal glutamine amidase-domain-containing protein [Suillus fuscotomentosus]|uniref:Protein N-terminal glutamine amidohydrolase n=1 Tax=Suillus fuscotomentosus TaxID=1912939 RepID=A0AAD4EH28_9AGAM|nr:N-terminal glutamine amidase-domain-containing protein [Suillus fuscotomentosus]KAG1906005.1 N-terminal glutamine amidase-domain-containing protein [Suillus fuscotomentosus]
MLPKPLDSPYTSCYCEENIYFLVHRFLEQAQVKATWDIFAVIVSNATKTVALWSQLKAPAANTAVIWDYHAVLVLRSRLESHRGLLNTTLSIEEETWIYDFDSILEMPSRWEEYVEKTFPPDSDIPPQYRSLFRVISGEEYLRSFASDRSHMLSPAADSSNQYISPPPLYPIVCGPLAAAHGFTNNLMTHFVSMESSKGYGTVMDRETFVSWCSQA